MLARTVIIAILAPLLIHAAGERRSPRIDTGETSTPNPPVVDIPDPETQRELDALAEFERTMRDGSADELNEPTQALSAYQTSRRDKGAITPPRWAKRLAWPRTRAQGVMLARMGASEAVRSIWPKGVCVTRPDIEGEASERCGTGGELTSDVRTMAHVVINNRGSKASFRDWLDVMGFLSPHVAGGKAPSKPRQRWTKTLPATGDAPPSGWRDCHTSKARPCDGDWRIYAKTWPVFRQRVIRMWLGWTMPMAEGEPIAWGNAEDIRTFGRRRGLELIPCEGCSNGFMQRPPRVVSARAVARAMKKPTSRR